MAPKAQTARARDAKTRQRGDWAASPGIGWQHGPVPKPPTGLKPESRSAWTTWMRAWFAAHWTPDDLPGLVLAVQLYDQVQRGEFQRGTELRLMMDTYGITPKGQQDRRWKPPEPSPVGVPKASPYGKLEAVDL